MVILLKLGFLYAKLKGNLVIQYTEYHLAVLGIENLTKDLFGNIKQPIKTMKEHKYKCVICRKESTGWGNNPMPVMFHGRCCDKCNKTYVIPMRFMLLAQSKEDDEKQNH